MSREDHMGEGEELTRRAPTYETAVFEVAEMMRGKYDERRVYGAVLVTSRIWGVRADELLRDAFAELKGTTV